MKNIIFTLFLLLNSSLVFAQSCDISEELTKELSAEYSSDVFIIISKNDLNVYERDIKVLVPSEVRGEKFTNIAVLERDSVTNRNRFSVMIPANEGGGTPTFKFTLHKSLLAGLKISINYRDNQAGCGVDISYKIESE